MIDKPNIFLITIDCLRADFLGCLGNKNKPTPFLDKLAHEGILFKQTYSNAPYTVGSFPSILTSTYPALYNDKLELSPYRTTIAEVLKKAGYKTAGLNTNAYLSVYYNYGRGFDYFFDVLSEKKKMTKSKFKNIILRLIRKTPLRILLKIIPILPSPQNDAQKINKKALKWLKNNKSNPFFIWLHYLDVHGSYIPNRNYRPISKRRMAYLNKLIANRNKLVKLNIKKNLDLKYLSKKYTQKITKEDIKDIVRLYESNIRCVDDQLSIFFKNLKRLNLYNNSLFIITSDHGEEFYEHGLFSHFGQLYDELIHVPLIFKGPNLPKRCKIETLISLIDLAPTILDYLNLKKEDNFLGKSFLPLFAKSEGNYNRKFVVSELIKGYGPQLFSIRTNNYKLIYNVANQLIELYNIKDDPNEQNNIYNQNKVVAEDLKYLILDHIKMEVAYQNKAKEMDRIDKVIKKIKF
ncbi:MAG: sulfatase [Promethearchaeota archaeon]